MNFANETNESWTMVSLPGFPSFTRSHGLGQVGCRLCPRFWKESVGGSLELRGL